MLADSIRITKGEILKGFQTTSTQLSFSIHQDISTIENDWNELGARLSHYHFYHKPAWFKAYSQSLFNPENRLLFITVHTDNKILGLIPLEFLTLKKYIWPLKILRLPFNSHLDLSDCLICESIYDTVLEQLIHFINQQKTLKWDVFFMGGTPEDSHANKIFANSDNINNCYSVQHGASSYIQCKQSYDESIAHIASKFRRNISRLERKAEKQGKLDYYSYPCSIKNQSDLFQQYYQTFLDVEADSWKSKIQTAIKDNPPAVLFYQKLGEYFKAPDTCVINLLKLDDDVIAVQFGVRVDKRLNLLKIGFRQNYKGIGPGNIILSHTLKNSIEQNIKVVSTTTAPAWAEKWKSDSQKVYRHFIFNRTLGGLFAKMAFLLLPSYKKLKLQWQNFQANYLKKNELKGKH